MARVIILEGHRMTGKSTVARYLRNSINYATLINCTGFPDKGEPGLARISAYYRSFSQLLHAHKDSDTVFIFDRYMFSEMVYSVLYKDYDFTQYFNHFLDDLASIATVDVMFLELTSKMDMARRSKRDKVEFVNVQDSVEEIMKQRDAYRRVALATEIRQHPSVKVHRIQITNQSSKEVAKDIQTIYEESLVKQ